MFCIEKFAHILPMTLLATTYEGDSPQLLAEISNIVDAIEIAPDTIATTEGGRHQLRPEVLAEYEGLAGRMRFVAHGVGLSIGSYDKWDENYIGLLSPTLWGAVIDLP